MAEEGASSNSSVDDNPELGEQRHPSTYGTGIISSTRHAQNPFAIKTTTPIRSLADSTDYKEARPLVAPPTFVPGSESASPSVVTSTASRFTLRPSSLTAQTEKLKMSSNFISSRSTESNLNSQGEEKEITRQNDTVDSSTSNSKPNQNGKLLSSLEGEHSANPFRAVVNKSSLGEPSSSIATAPLLSSSEDSRSSAPSSDGASSFVFGQNLHERALVKDEVPFTSSSASIDLTTFKAAATSSPGKEHTEPSSQHTETSEASEASATNPASTDGPPVSEPDGAAQDKSGNKSLSESAEAYQRQQQAKRKFDEVAVITGEEEEFNVLQINCKLFSFSTESGTYQERGRGSLRLNDREMGTALYSRVVMRTQGSLRLILNTKVWAGMTVERPSHKTVRLTAIDTDGIKVFLVMANPKDAEQLFNALDWRVTTLKSRQEGTKQVSEASSTTTEAISNLSEAHRAPEEGGSGRKKARLSEENLADSSSTSKPITQTVDSSDSDFTADSSTNNSTTAFESVESEN